MKMKNARKYLGIAATVAGIAFIAALVKDLVTIKKITTDEDEAAAPESAKAPEGGSDEPKAE